MLKFRIGLVIVVGLTGCASSSGVFQVGPNLYQVTATAITSFGGVGTASASAVDSAKQFCGKDGKTAQFNSATSDSQFTQGTSDMKFSCL